MVFNPCPGNELLRDQKDIQMTTKNMWVKFDNIRKIPMPVSYLREQANYLGEATGHILQGEVVQSAKDERFEAELDIVVPNLNYYRHTLLRVVHSIRIYPGEIHDLVNEEKHICENEGSFLSRLEQILTSQGVRNIIETLISQSQT